LWFWWRHHDIKEGVHQLFTLSVIRSKQLFKRPRVEVCHSIFGYWDMSHQRCVIFATRASIPLYLCIYLSIYLSIYVSNPMYLSITGTCLKMGVPENVLPDIANTWDFVGCLFWHEPTAKQYFKFLIQF
jgi:hypothetical protein